MYWYSVWWWPRAASTVNNMSQSSRPYYFHCAQRPLTASGLVSTCVCLMGLDSLCHRPISGAPLVLAKLCFTYKKAVLASGSERSAGSSLGQCTVPHYLLFVCHSTKSCMWRQSSAPFGSSSLFLLLNYTAPKCIMFYHWFWVCCAWGAHSTTAGGLQGKLLQSKSHCFRFGSFWSWFIYLFIFPFVPFDHAQTASKK